MSEVRVAGKTGTAQAAAETYIVKDTEGNPVLDKEVRVVRAPLLLATMDHTTTTPWYRGWGADGTDRNHAWFIGYAPAEKPQVAFAVLVQYGGSGGQIAAKTATKILAACIEHGVVKPEK